MSLPNDETLGGAATLAAGTETSVSVSCEDALQLNAHVSATNAAVLDAVTPLRWEFSNDSAAGWIDALTAVVGQSHNNHTGALNAGGAVSMAYKAAGNFNRARIPWKYARLIALAGVADITGFSIEIDVIDRPR